MNRDLAARGIAIDRLRERLAHRPRMIMGILNATPDSFSEQRDQTEFSLQRRVLDRLMEDGAEIVDIGGQSAITGIEEISVDEEITRIGRVIDEAVARGLVVSVDTYRARVAEFALDHGASIINDYSGAHDPDILSVVASKPSYYVATHNLGRPKQRLTDAGLYRDLSSEVRSQMRDLLDRAAEQGVSEHQIIVDIGPDLSKTPQQTIDLLRDLDSVLPQPMPRLVALSRKDFIGALLNEAPQQRDYGSLAAFLWLATRHDNLIFRTHNVRALRHALTVFDALEGHSELESGVLLDRRLWRSPRG